MSNLVFIPVEYFRREFTAKAALATYLAAAGVPVVFGHKWYVRRSAVLNGSVGDIYLHNHAQSKNDAEDLASIINRGVKLIGYEDEGALDFVNLKDQLTERNNLSGYSNFHFWLCWGKNERAVLSNEFPDLAIFCNIGTPRSALWGEFGTQLWSKEILKDIRPKYGEYLLIATSFQARANEKYMSAIKRLNNIYGSHTVTTIKNFIKNESESEAAKLLRMEILVNEILTKSSYNIVLRPYFEKSNYIEKQIRRINPNRIFIDDRLNITPLVIGCAGLLHMGSTVAIESTLLGRKSIFIKPFLEGVEVSRLPNAGVQLSSLCSTPLESANDISSILNLSKVENFSLDFFIDSPNALFFYSEFLKLLISINPAICAIKPKELHNISLMQRLLYYFRVRIKRSSTYRYDRLKRPKVSRRKIKQLVRIILKTFVLDPTLIKISKIDSSTFLFTRK
jgi:surface carbohydrate biosynthesis protein